MLIKTVHFTSSRAVSSSCSEMIHGASTQTTLLIHHKAIYLDSCSLGDRVPETMGCSLAKCHTLLTLGKAIPPTLHFPHWCKMSMPPECVMLSCKSQTLPKDQMKSDSWPWAHTPSCLFITYCWFCWTEHREASESGRLCFFVRWVWVASTCWICNRNPIAFHTTPTCCHSSQLVCRELSGGFFPLWKR